MFEVKGTIGNTLQRIIRFANKSTIKNLLIITLCVAMFFVQIFFPYNYYASADRSGNSEFQVGVHYVYEQDELNEIYGQIYRIKNLGISVIRITLECNPNDPYGNDPTNQKTNALFAATDQLDLDVALVIPNHEDLQNVNYYLNRWGSHLEYIQVLNEPELSASWDAGALFTDDEIVSKFERVYQVVDSYNLPAKLYTNFGAGYVLRSNVPMELSKHLDFVGLDVYMDAFLVLSPHFVGNLRSMTDKDIVITEFGMSTSNSLAQSDFIIRGLNLFKSMGLKGCWIAYWNSDYDYYGIRGRPAEQAIGEWIAENVN
ncbi:MAG: hypothetical protein ACQCN5_04540 [Candidatus Bathyarchaeia archaeon]|jgi:hypothetical protein